MFAKPETPSNMNLIYLFVGALSLSWQSSHVEARRPRRGMSFEDMVIERVEESYRMRSLYSRPVINYNHSIEVKFAIQLTQIMGLDEQDQVLTLNIWDQMKWFDEHLSWKKEEWGGVEEIRIPCDKLWTPDIKLYNYADYRLDEHRDALCIVGHDGSIFHMPQVVYRSSCDVNVYAFPFDVQECWLRFGSWSYQAAELNLTFYENKTYIDLSEYKVTSASWEIIDVPANRTVLTYSCCPNEKWIRLEYKIVFQRRSALFNYILILPCILLTSITLILFWIPPESPAKTQLGLAIFIAFFVLLKLLEKHLPPATKSMPLLGIYYCLNMILITLSSFLNVLIVDLTTHGLRAMAPPKLGKLFFVYLAKCLHLQDLTRPFVVKKVKSRTPREGDLGNVEENKWKHDAEGSNEALATLAREQTMQGGGPLVEIEAKLNELREFLKMQAQRVKERDQKDLIAKQWKAIALILDRIFFIAYLFIIIMSLCYTMIVLTSQRSQFQSTKLLMAKGSNTEV